jgi:hypothetical protein
MGDVTAVNMDVVTDKSGHAFTPLAVSACITPMAPAPAPIPYPVTGTSTEGVTDECMRTKVNGGKCMTVGSVFNACHGNEPGTLKEVVSLNTGGPCFAVMGAPTVFIELGMAAMTGSPGFLNKAPTAGAGGSASGASGASAGGGSGGDGSGGDGSGNNNQGSNGGGGGGGGGAGASGPSPAEKKLAAEKNADPDDGKNADRVAARKKVAADFYKEKGGLKPDEAENHMKGIDFNKPVKTGPPPQIESPQNCYQNPGGNPAKPGQYFAKDGNSPDSLGIANEGAAFGPPPDNKYGQGPIGPKQSTTYNMDPKTEYMQSTAAPVKDTWSSPANSHGPAKEYDTGGGGTQDYVPRKANSGNPPTPVAGTTKPWGT